MEPAEFILRPDSTVAASLYGTTQPGIMNPREISVFVKDRPLTATQKSSVDQ